MNETLSQAAHVTVANAILRQLGGHRFTAMTGAKHFSASNEGRGKLSFQLPARFAKSGINIVRVTLTHADTYTVEFVKFSGRGVNMKWTTLATRDDVYADSLRAVFTAETGLDTSL